MGSGIGLALCHPRLGTGPVARCRSNRSPARGPGSWLRSRSTHALSGPHEPTAAAVAVAVAVAIADDRSRSVARPTRGGTPRPSRQRGELDIMSRADSLNRILRTLQTESPDVEACALISEDSWSSLAPCRSTCKSCAWRASARR